MSICVSVSIKTEVIPLDIDGDDSDHDSDHDGDSIRQAARIMWIAIHVDKQVYKLSSWIRSQYQQRPNNICYKV